MAIPFSAEHSWVSRLFRPPTARARATSSRSDQPGEDRSRAKPAARAARWGGATTWLVPSTEAQDVTGLPRGLDIADLTAGELRAAVELRFVAAAVISDDDWQALMAVPEEDVPASARTLEKKIRRWSAAHHISTPTEPISLPIEQMEA